MTRALVVLSVHVRVKVLMNMTSPRKTHTHQTPIYHTSVEDIFGFVELPHAMRRDPPLNLSHVELGPRNNASEGETNQGIIDACRSNQLT